MIPDPSTARIIHDTMIADELARLHPETRREWRRHHSRSPLTGVRRGTARALTRLADRIAPTPAPAAKQPV